MSRYDVLGVLSHCAPVPAAALQPGARSRPHRPLPVVPGGEAVSVGAIQNERWTVANPAAGPAVAVPSSQCLNGQRVQQYPAHRHGRPTNSTSWPPFHPADSERTIGTPGPAFARMGAAQVRVAVPLLSARQGGEGGESPSPPHRCCSKGGEGGESPSPPRHCCSKRGEGGESPSPLRCCC